MKTTPSIYPVSIVDIGWHIGLQVQSKCQRFFSLSLSLSGLSGVSTRHSPDKTLQGLATWKWGAKEATKVPSTPRIWLKQLKDFRQANLSFRAALGRLRRPLGITIFQIGQTASVGNPWATAAKMKCNKIHDWRSTKSFSACLLSLSLTLTLSLSLFLSLLLRSVEVNFCNKMFISVRAPAALYPLNPNPNPIARPLIPLCLLYPRGMCEHCGNGWIAVLMCWQHF